MWRGRRERKRERGERGERGRERESGAPGARKDSWFAPCGYLTRRSIHPGLVQPHQGQFGHTAWSGDGRP